MAHRRFYVSELASRVTVCGDEFHHLKKVMRVKLGEEVELYDGNGTSGQGRIITLTDSGAVVEMASINTTPRPQPRVIVAPPLLKSAIMNLMLDKLCEMGVDQIRPLVFTRTEIAVKESMQARWRRIAVQALKVNHLSWAAEIFPPLALPEFLEQTVDVACKYFLDLAGSEPLRAPFSFPVLVLIGPPGDFTPAERSRLLTAGFLSRRINRAVLKSETAALALVGILQNG